MNFWKKSCRLLLVAAFWFFVWWGGSALYGKPLIFPAPTDVIKELFAMIQTSEFYLLTLHSLLNVLIGLLCAIVCGILLAILTSYVPYLKDLFLPVMTVIKATPVASFIILVFLLLGQTRVPAFITFLIVLPIVWTNLDTGFHSINRELLEVARVYRFSLFKRLSGMNIGMHTFS